MATVPETTRDPRRNPIYFVLGGIVLLVVLAMLFLTLAGHRLGHDVRDSAPPAGSVPGAAGQADSR